MNAVNNVFFRIMTEDFCGMGYGKAVSYTHLIPSESQYQHTAEKMRQVADVFGEYESYLEQLHEGSAEWDYIDGEDESALLCENLRALKPLADTEVFIDGFDDFSLLDLTTVCLLYTSRCV